MGQADVVVQYQEGINDVEQPISWVDYIRSVWGISDPRPPDRVDPSTISSDIYSVDRAAAATQVSRSRTVWPY